MKLLNAILLVILISVSNLIGQRTTHNFNFEGQNRFYVQYVPSVYDGTTSVPLVIALHGLGDNANNFSYLGFNEIADSANLIVITPEALVDPALQSTAWNSGAGTLGIYPNSNINDVGFISFLIDSISNTYNIDANRIFVTGFSMGGFMTNRLGCELSNTITAIAPVAAFIGSNNICDNPLGKIPVLQIHGTEDVTVGYTSNLWGMGIDDYIDHWVDNNNCEDENQYTDTRTNKDTTDVYSVNHYRYFNRDTNLIFEHIKVTGATHTWLMNNEIDYTQEIWSFFKNTTVDYDFSCKQIASTISSLELHNYLSFYPNPVKDNLNISLDGDLKIISVSIKNIIGKLLVHEKQEKLKSVNSIDVSKLPNGVFILDIETDKGNIQTKINKH